MKRFLIETALFAMVLFLLATVLDRVICKGLLEMEDYRFQDYRAMLDGGMTHDVLIMGNSRGKSHYDPYLIDSLCHVSSFCIGIGGYPVNAQVAKYHLYREHNQKPRIIIQNIDYMTVAILDDVRHEHQSEQFFPMIYDRQARIELKKLGYGFLELNIPLYRFIGYQQVIKNGLLEGLHLKHYVVRPAYKGHRPEEGAWDGNQLSQMEIRHADMSQEGKQALESYLAECKKDSIDVVLVNSPMYIGAKEKLTGLDEARHYFEQLAEKYGFKYLDFVDDFPISQDSSNFCVSVHMNPMATKQFTQILCDSLLRLGVLAFPGPNN